jgi:outer membrane lipoprotein carrier protein
VSRARLDAPLGGLLVLAAAAAGARAQSAGETLDRAAAVYGAMSTARVTFTQTVTNPLTQRAVTSSGQMLQRLPGRYAVTFTDPAGDRIVCDGKVVWLYLPSTNPGQAIKMRVGESGAGVPDFTAWLLNAPKERFVIADGGAAAVAGHDTRIVELTPKRAGAPFTSAKLWIEAGTGLVRQFETVDVNGSLRRVRIDTIEINVPVSPRAFTFTPPAGVNVYDPGAAN